MGAGVLPLAIRNGTPYYLFSREGMGKDKGYWSDFGGGREKGETFRETALREASEESDGVLGTRSDIDKLLNENVIDHITMGGYRLYVVHVDLDLSIPSQFRKRYLRAKRQRPSVLGINGRYEKDHVAWVSQKSLAQQKKYIRPWFRRFASVLARTDYVIDPC